MNAIAEACQRIRETTSLSAIVSRSLKLKRVGREWAACCPFHADKTPSFTIYAEDRRWQCFGGCGGGDQLDFIMKQHGVQLVEAIRMIDSGALQVLVRRPASPDDDRERNTTPAALAIWRAAGPAPGTPAETYLRWRGLHLPIPASIRFAILPYGSRGSPLPCLVALIASAENKAIGVHRIYLRADGKAKADVPKPKLSLGRVSGGAIRLAPAAAELIVCEGLEDGLTLQQETGKAVWVAAGSAMLPSMRFPAVVRLVSIGRDNDEAGVRSAQAAADVFTEQGREVRIFSPLPEFKDFNAELEGTDW